MDYQDVQRDLLTRLSAKEDKPLAVISSLLQEHSSDGEIYGKLLASLLSSNVPEDNAQLVFHRLLRHHQEMARELDRDLDIRVSAMDFAIQHPELVRDPVVVDRETLQLSNRLAAVDELTGLFNRRFLEIALGKEINRAQRYDHVFSLLFLDIDDFKIINDTHGHQVGDQVLKRFGEAVLRLLRNEDIGARFGGEEFVIILPQTDASGALAFARRLQSALNHEDALAGTSITFSGGIAVFPVSGLTARQLLNNADTALYQAKLNGKNQVRVHGAEKRKARREPTSVRGKAETGSGTIQVSLSDISEGGLAGKAGSLLRPGHKIKLTIDRDTSAPKTNAHSSELVARATREANRPSPLVATIVWSRRITGSEYRFGASWTSVDSASRSSLLPREHFS
ncbi:MAG: diguanylate cyclase [Spirochaetales bacterium]